jgi:hypothetical protein
MTNLDVWREQHRVRWTMSRYEVTLTVEFSKYLKGRMDNSIENVDHHFAQPILRLLNREIWVESCFH